MDKLLLSLFLTMLLASLTVNSAPISTSKIISAIEQQQQRQKKLSRLTKTNSNNNDESQGEDFDDNGDDDYIKIENVDVQQRGGNKNANIMREYISDINTIDDGDSNSQFIGRFNIIDEMRKHRQNKMIGYFNFNPYYAVPYASPVFYPQEFFEDFAAFYGYNNDDDEIMSRQNPGRRRPAGSFKNSPIYYIRLPPTPYMFVPGLGYISQPPSYAPMAPPPPPPPPPAISSFYNLPIDFISNGKPTNIYQYQSPAYAPQPQFIPQTPSSPASYPMFQRPQRPYAERPMYPQESKVTNLKGAFLFNGRPEEIYVLPPSSIYPDPRFISPFY